MTKKIRKYESEYKEYCNNLLEQLENGGMGKMQLFALKARYQNSKKMYNAYVNLIENKDDEELNVVFKPEGI